MKTFFLKIIRKLKESHNKQKKEWGTYGMLGLIFMVLPDIIYIFSDEQLIPMFLNDLNVYLYIVSAFFFYYISMIKMKKHLKLLLFTGLALEKN